ncbi:MAG: hypothetical protein NVSMB27_26840 [Ktedonobacteraceae bacterium]
MIIATDPLSLVFIACFLFGLIFLIASALLGNLGHGGGDSHAAAHHFDLHLGGHAQAGASHTTGTHVAVNHGTPHASMHGATAQNQQHAVWDNLSVLSYVNPTSVVLFLLGFGFFGYVFHNTAHFLFPITLLLAGVSGLVIAALLLVMLGRLFGDSEGATVQDVSDRTGLLGKVSITIQENSLGEIIYTSPGGMRKSIPARSVDGHRLERDQEVVVVNYQHGIAEVDTWERFINENEEEEVQAAMPNSDELAKLRTLLEESDTANTELVIRKELQKE